MAVLCLAVAVAMATVVLPKIMGASPYTVLTGSMHPAIRSGDLAIVKPVSADEIQVGDVITYQLAPGEPAVVTHRVVGISATPEGERRFLTQGDANSRPDADPVVSPQVRGKVAYTVPWMGHVNSSLDSSSRHVLLTAAAVALIGYGIWQFGSAAAVRFRRVHTGVGQ